MKDIKKSFPADTTLDMKTFLNDPKVNGELYAYLLSMSVGEEGETRVYKNKLPNQKEIAKLLRISVRTLTRHMTYLIDTRYVKVIDKYYVIPNIEKVYFTIPLDTVRFLIHTSKDTVIKTYIYLGQRWKYKGSEYEFTLEELGDHIGRKINNHSCVYEELNDILKCLQNNGLISYCEYYNGKSKKKRLLNFGYTPIEREF